MRSDGSRFMQTGSVIIVSLVAAMLLGFGVFCITVFVHQYFFPPVVVVNGVERPVMPVGSLLLGSLCGTVSGIVTFVFAYKRMDKL